MRITLKTLVVLLLAVLIPLRAMAAVTVGLCATGHEDPVAAMHGHHGHGTEAEQHGSDEPSPSGKSATPSCSYCVEHCSGAAFAPSAVRAVDPPAVAQESMFFAERASPALFSDQLDRPPLA